MHKQVQQELIARKFVSIKIELGLCNRNILRSKLHTIKNCFVKQITYEIQWKINNSHTKLSDV